MKHVANLDTLSTLECQCSLMLSTCETANLQRCIDVCFCVHCIYALPQDGTW